MIQNEEDYISFADDDGDDILYYIVNNIEGKTDW